VEVRRMLEQGALRPADVVETLVTAYLNALDRVVDRAQAVLAHPFGLLAEIGLTEDDVAEDVLRTLTEGCRAVGAMVQVSERWRCPSVRVTQQFVAAGVRLVAASDAYRARDLGRWEHVSRVAALLQVPVPAPSAAE
jgi:putative hydrolase